MQGSSRSSGIDEMTALHEAVQDRVHVWGQADLIPIVIAGGIRVVDHAAAARPAPPAGTLLMLARRDLGVSQGSTRELNEEWGWTIVPEELLEMCRLRPCSAWPCWSRYATWSARRHRSRHAAQIDPQRRTAACKPDR